MGQHTLGGDDLTALRTVYARMITEDLPEQARRHGGWPIERDHCFGRVVLDNVFEGVWYEQITGSPAYEFLSYAQLRTAITIADRMRTEGRPAVAALNRRSLRWREEYRRAD